MSEAELQEKGTLFINLGLAKELLLKSINGETPAVSDTLELPGPDTGAPATNPLDPRANRATLLGQEFARGLVRKGDKALSDGNCAFNAVALGLQELYECGNLNFTDPNMKSLIETFARVNGGLTTIGETHEEMFERGLQDKSALFQEKMARALRAFAVEALRGTSGYDADKMAQDKEWGSDLDIDKIGKLLGISFKYQVVVAREVEREGKVEVVLELVAQYGGCSKAKAPIMELCHNGNHFDYVHTRCEMNGPVSAKGSSVSDLVRGVAEKAYNAVPWFTSSVSWIGTQALDLQEKYGLTHG